ncbi:MAG: hypothetical protein M0Z53_08300 [Thermaerobacter sp.]|nr:hypothetical protein [Thermaerobacter sp.]
MRCTGAPIDDGYCRPGIIDKDFVTGLMGLAEHDVKPFAPTVVVHAKLGVLQGIAGMLPLIFEPRQFPCHPFSGPQILINPGPIRFQPRTRTSLVAGVQAPFQLGVADVR